MKSTDKRKQPKTNTFAIGCLIMLGALTISVHILITFFIELLK